MKLATRLVAVTSLTVFCASGLAGALLLRMERSQLLADEVSEARLLTRSLQVSVENALRDGQTPDISELLQRMEVVARQVDVLVFTDDGALPLVASSGSDPAGVGVAALRQVADAGTEAIRLFEDVEGPPRLVTGAPLRGDDGARLGTLVVTRPLYELEADLNDTSRLAGSFVVVFATVTTLLMLVLLRREVTTPLSGLVAATRRLGEDLDTEVALPASSSVEFATMWETLRDLQRQLVAARDARAAEALARENLQRQLRDADKLIAVGQLAAGVAHEIGSPLQVLVGRARLLAQDPTQTEEARRQAGLIEAHATRIAGIVGRLQDVGRRRPTRLGPLDLAEPVRKVMWLLEPEARRRGVELTWTVPPEGCLVCADGDEMEQVVLNLALNALQATPSGGKVRVDVEPLDGGGRLRVRDDGRGMDAETLSRVFEPFFTTRGEEGGTGLGLAVVKSITDRHRAKVSIASEPGEGTVVDVWWPGGRV